MRYKRFILSIPLLVIGIAVLTFLRSPQEQGNASRTANKDEAGFLFAPTHESHSASSRPAEVTAPANSAGHVEELTREMNALRRELEELKRSGDPNAVSEPEDALLTFEEQRQREWERTTRTTAFLDASFQREGKDASWSHSAEQQVSGAFGANEVAAGSDLQQLACQATLCRIESRHDDPDAERTFMTQLGRLEAFGDAEAFSQRREHADGSVEIVTYVTRSGYRLPVMR